MTGGEGKVRIIRIIARLNVGGPAIHTILLTSELNKRGYEDTLVCGRISDNEGDMMYLAEDKKTSPVILRDLGRDISPVKDMRSFISLVSMMKKERPHIVHTHTAKAGTLGRLAAIFTGVPIKIHTFHGHVFDGYFNPAKAMVFLWIERFLGLFTDRVVTVSGLVRDEIVNKLKVVGQGKCSVIPLGFELEQFLSCEDKKGLLRKSLGIEDDAVVIGIVGRLVPIKNHRMFLNAAKIVLSGKPAKIKFIIIGDGENRKYLEGYAEKLALGPHVIFTGWRRDLAEVYAGLDIVALTSFNEGTPVSVIEAMASAKPVVVTDVGGMRDLVTEDESGFLVKSDDAEDLARKILRLIEDKEKRVKFGLRGREFVRSRYSKERLVDDIDRLYKACINEKNLKLVPLSH